MLEKFDILEYKSQTILLSVGILLFTTNSPEMQKKIEEIKKISDHEALGLLIWLQVATYSDLLFTVNYLSHFASNPRKVHWNTIKHTITYVKSTINYGIIYYYKASLQLISFVNSDYANN